jgi:uncharacterized protein YndB with AHSA1/START domain
MTPAIDQTIRKSIHVKASAERAFRVFTEGIDTWWPRTHRIGTTPMKKTVLEGRAGGRCYSTHEDGAECDWGQVLEWDPPRRFVMSWQITPSWQFEPNLANSSEVEVRFTSERDGTTRVDLEHRHFERHGAGWEQMRGQIESPGGWGGILQMFAKTAESGE